MVAFLFSRSSIARRRKVAGYLHLGVRSKG
jgi:hypothetical protein